MITNLILRNKNIQVTQKALKVAAIFEQKMEEELTLCMRDWRPLTSLERAFPYVVERLDRESKTLAKEIVEHNMKMAQSMTADEDWMSELIQESMTEAGVASAPKESDLKRVLDDLKGKAQIRRNFEHTRGRLYTTERGSFGSVGRGRVPFRFPILFHNLLSKSLELVTVLVTNAEETERQKVA